MQTLAPPTIERELSTVLCETPQTITGNTALENEDEVDGKIGDGGKKPQPLQGGGDATERAPGREKESGSEGDGT